MFILSKLIVNGYKVAKDSFKIFISFKRKYLIMSDTKQKEAVPLTIDKYTVKANTNHAIQTRSATQNTVHSSSMSSQKLVVLNWLGCLFFGFIPPLLLLLLKRDDAYVKSQAKEALNWSITSLIATLVLSMLAAMIGFVLLAISTSLAAIPTLIVPLFGLVYMVVCFVGAYKGFSGKDFRAPFNIRMIK